MLFVKRMRLVKRIFVEKFRVFPLKHARAKVTPDPVVAGVAKHRRNRQRHHQNRETHFALRRERARNEQQ